MIKKYNRPVPFVIVPNALQVKSDLLAQFEAETRIRLPSVVRKALLIQNHKSLGESLASLAIQFKTRQEKTND